MRDEVGRLHVAHIMGVMRAELRTAECDEERWAIRAPEDTGNGDHGRGWTPLGCGSAAADSLRAAARRFLHFSPRYSEDIRMAEFDEFFDIARHVRRCSPGPEGVPYHTGMVGSCVPLRVLYSAYTDRLLVFMPKGGATPGIAGCCGPASQFRPLTLSNSCQTLESKVLGASLKSVAATLAHSGQRRVIRGRRMLANVLETQVRRLKRRRFSEWHPA